MKNIDPIEIFGAISNSVRLRCLYIVATAKDVCVCEVVAAVGIAQPAASKALNTLKGAGLLDARRDANWTYYSLNAEMPEWLRTITDSTVSEIGNKEPYRSDKRRLQRLTLRPTVCAENLRLTRSIHR